MDKILVNGEVTDTLSPLTKGTVKGRVLTSSGSLDSKFNGTLEMKIIDKKIQTDGLDNEESGYPYPYFTQEGMLFKGQATVKAGLFSIDFILPKNTRRDLDVGKFSFYSSTDSLSLSGFDKSVVIGGEMDSSSTDKEGPVIDLFYQ